VGVERVVNFVGCCASCGRCPFLFWFLSGEKLRCFRWAWETHQSLDVLRRRCQEELLPNEIYFVVNQATQPDLILQFGEPGGNLLDPAVREPAARAGREQGLRTATESFVNRLATLRAGRNSCVNV